MTIKNQRIGRGLVAGLVGGLVASWAMNQFQAVWSKASESAQGQPKQLKEGESHAEAEDPTMKVAGKLSSSVLDRALTREEKRKAGPIVHYAFGSVMGALYGIAAELLPNVTRGFGTGFGAILFVAADEIAVPALGLSDTPAEAPLSSHVYGFVSHLVYGATTEGIRRAAMVAL